MSGQGGWTDIGYVRGSRAAGNGAWTPYELVSTSDYAEAARGARSKQNSRTAQFFWTLDVGRSESSLMGLSETSRRPGRADETSKFRATGSQNVVHGALGVVLERRKLSTFIKSQLLSPEKLDSGHKSREEAVERQSARALMKARLLSLTSITSINELSELPASRRTEQP